MTSNSPWNLKLRVVSPEVPEPVFTEVPVSRELWERIREQARLAGMPADQWISRQIRGELQAILAAARSSAPLSLETSCEATRSDTPAWPARRPPCDTRGVSPSPSMQPHPPPLQNEDQTTSSADRGLGAAFRFGDRPC